MPAPDGMPGGGLGSYGKNGLVAVVLATSNAISNFAYFSIWPVVWTRTDPIEGACGAAAFVQSGITKVANTRVATRTRCILVCPVSFVCASF